MTEAWSAVLAPTPAQIIREVTHIHKQAGVGACSGQMHTTRQVWVHMPGGGGDVSKGSAMPMQTPTCEAVPASSAPALQG